MRSHELLHGLLDALSLRALREGPRHGHAIARWIEAEAAEAHRPRYRMTPQRFGVSDPLPQMLQETRRCWRRLVVAPHHADASRDGRFDGAGDDSVEAKPRGDRGSKRHP